MWHYCETGSGRPLVLLHGIGMSHVAWNAVVPYLCSTRRVFAFDTAGFGSTPRLPAGTLPTIANLVDGLEQSFRGIGIALPVDIAGNSLGGYMALEAARRGIARSVVAISPAGLWGAHGPRHVRYVFAFLRFMTRDFATFTKTVLRVRWLRELALAVPLSVGSRRMPVVDALRVVDDMGASPVFEEVLVNTHTSFSGREITVPVTVAFGRRDWILPGGSRRRDELPPQTRWIEKRTWGHVPMWADPAGVSELILEGTR